MARTGPPRRGWLEARRERAAARETLRVPTTERTIAFCRDAQGNPVLASTAACYWLSSETVQRMPWSRVVQARWSTPTLTMRIEEVPRPAGPDGTSEESSEGPSAVLREVMLELDDAAGIPAAVRACVTESVVFNERIELDAGVVLLVARRVDEPSPGGADVHWTIAFEDDESAADPAIRAQAEAALREVRVALGI